MAFGKFFGKSKVDFPPGSKKKGVEEEYVPAEKPETLPNGIAHEAPEELEASISAYITAWNQYAAEHNVFISEEKQALWKAAKEAKDLSDELHATENPMEKNKREAELVAKIEEIRGPLSQALEERIEKNADRLSAETPDGQAPEKDESQDPAKATPKENKENMRASVSEIENISGTGTPKGWEKLEEQAPAERAAMDAAEAAYLEKYKEYYRQKGAKESKEPEDLLQLKDEFDKARIAYGAALTNSAKSRLEERGMKSGVEGPKKNYTKKDVLERYNKLVRYNAIIKPAAEKRYEARLEALGSRERGMVMKSLAFVAQQNKKLEDRFGKNGARVVRAGAVSLGVAGVAAFGTAGLLGALGLGATRFGWSLARTFASAGVAEATAQAYAKTLGKKKQGKAAKNLTTEGRHGDDTLEISELETYDLNRMKLLKRADQRTLEKEKMRIRAGMALLLGAGSTAASMLSELPSSAEGAHDLAQAAGNAPVDEHIASSSTSISHDAIPTPAGTSPMPETLHMAEGATIHEPGEGTDRLFADLKANIEQNGLFKGQESPALKHFLETHPDTLSREMGDIYGTRGMVTHAGDQFFVDEHQNIYFQPKSGAAEMFIENKPDGAGHGYTIHQDFTGQPLAPAPEAPAPAPEQALEQTPAAEPQQVPVTPSPETATPTQEAPAAAEAAPTAGLAAPSESVPPSAPAESDAFPRNPYLTTPDETVYAPETVPATPSSAPADADAFPKNPYLTPPEEGVPAPEARVAEPSPAAESISTPEPTRYALDGDGNKIAIPPESAFIFHPEGYPGVGRTEGLMYPEGTPGMPEVHTEGMIPAEDSASVEAPSAETDTSGGLAAEQVSPESPSAAEVITNSNGVTVRPNEFHLYGAPDPNVSGKESLIAYGRAPLTAEGKSQYIETIAKLAQENPGKTIYYQSPTPYSVGGSEQPWIAAARTESASGPVVFPVTPDPSHPELIGVVLNPDMFTRLVK